jgi:hypothetical protein
LTKQRSPIVSKLIVCQQSRLGIPCGGFQELAERVSLCLLLDGILIVLKCCCCCFCVHLSSPFWVFGTVLSTLQVAGDTFHSEHFAVKKINKRHASNQPT